jgi:carboxyl-terminal processing protease
LVALLLLAGCATTTPRTPLSLTGIPPAQIARAQENLRLFTAVWDLVNRKHFDPKFQGVDWEAAAATHGPKAIAAPDETALYTELNEMLAALHDSHTHALTPAQAQERRTHLRARTGFSMVRVEGKWIVTDVMPASPAAIAGVKPGWIVVARNGEPMGGRLDFRPKEGDEIVWDFLDDKDQKVRLTPTAKRLSTGPLQVERTLDDGFVYLRFDEFDGKDRRWLSRELKEHATAPGVVIDLRRNPGGETFSLGISIGEFFDHPVDCGTFISRSGARSVKNSWQLGSAEYRGRVVVLIDGATGSAAEIFSAVLQDHGRATLVGRKTAGAVLASWFYHLPDGGELQLSREDYMAPKGRRIEGKGIEPDITVPRTLEDVRTGRDRDLEAALAVLRKP